MFCKECGSEIKDNAEFCPNCGTAVVKETADGTPKKGFSVDMLKFEKGRSDIIALISAAVMFIMVFLPYVTISLFGYSESQSLIKGDDGIFFIIIAIAGVITGLIGKEKPMIIVGGIACAFALFKIFKFSDVLKEVSSHGLSDVVKKGIGFYLMILSSLGLLAAPFVKKYLNK